MLQLATIVCNIKSQENRLNWQKRFLNYEFSLTNSSGLGHVQVPTTLVSLLAIEGNAVGAISE